MTERKLGKGELLENVFALHQDEVQFEDIKKAVDKTKGIVKEEKKIETSNDEGIVIERNTRGGFDMYRDYTKLDKNKFKRLTR